MSDWRNSALTLAIGAVGALLAWAINMPLAFLAGPAVAVAGAGIAGAPVVIARPLRETGFVLVGLTIGSLVTPDSIDAMLRWPIAFVLLVVLTFLTPWVGQWVLTRSLGFGDRDEAFLASSPGHLSLVVALADSLSLSVTRPTVLAAIRVLTLTLCVPFAARMAGLDVGPGLQSGAHAASWLAIAAQIIATLALAPLLGRMRLPAPYLLAAMMIGATTHLTQWVDGNIPVWLSQCVLVLMGSLIGTRFVGTSLRALVANLGTGLLIVGLSTGLALVFALIAAPLSGLPLLDLLLGFAPGGLETMVIVGAAMGADPSFVAAAHVLRLIVLALILTGYATRMSRRDSP